MPELIATEELSMPFPDGHALLIGVGAYAHLPHWHVPTTMRMMLKLSPPRCVTRSTAATPRRR